MIADPLFFLFQPVLFSVWLGKAPHGPAFSKQSPFRLLLGMPFWRCEFGRISSTTASVADQRPARELDYARIEETTETVWPNRTYGRRGAPPGERFGTNFVTFFLGSWIPNSTTALSRWCTPDQSGRTQETVPDRCRFKFLSFLGDEAQLNHEPSFVLFCSL